jgi:TaqI-like C-terminal specificity domain
LAFISPNKWFRAKYGEKLRKHIADTCQVHSITDFGELPVFKSAATFPMIFIGQNGEVNKSTLFTQVKSLEPPYPDVVAIIRDKGQHLPVNALNGSNWTLTDTSNANRLKKMEAAGIPLLDYVNGKIYSGIKTGFNKAFHINEATRAELIAQDPKSAEIIKPLAVGDDVRKWRVNYKEKYLIYSPWDLKIDNYPAIKKHLTQWQQELKARPECKAGRYNWWCMARYGSEYVDAFDKPKIIYPDIAKESRFTFDNVGNYLGNTAYIIPASDLYLLGILNSCLIWEYAKANFSCLGDPEKGGRFRFIYQSVVKIPIPNASTAEREAISNLVQKCLDANGIDCETWEKEIDDRVATLYGL